MQREQLIIPNKVPAVMYTDDAVGVLEKHWYIAIVNHNSEKKSSEQLRQLGYETYVPTQTYQRITPQGRRKNVERVALSSMIFIHTTEGERRETLKLPFIFRYMTNRAGTLNEYNRRPLAVIPEEQIERLKFMLYHSENPVTIEEMPIRLGDRVRVVRGGLQGLEGSVVFCEEGHAYIVVQLQVIGCAKVKINLLDTERIQ